MPEHRTTASAEPPVAPAPAAPPERPRPPLWRRVAEAVVAGHRADVPF